MFRVLVITAVCLAVSTAAALEDPTRPSGGTPQATMGTEAPIRLQAIFVSADRNMALIDNRMMAVGQAAADFTLLEIDRDRVLMRRASGELQELHLTRKIKDRK